MAQVHVDAAYGLQEYLARLQGDISGTVEKAVRAAEPAAIQALKNECDKHHKSQQDKTMGEMAASIKAKGPVHNARGCYDIVRPTGKDSKGVRNMEKLAYLEYGTIKQDAAPVMRNATNAAAPKIREAMKRVLGEAVKP